MLALCQCLGPRCTGLTHRIRRSLLRQSGTRRSACEHWSSRCCSSQAESQQGEMMWTVNFSATLLYLLLYDCAKCLCFSRWCRISTLCRPRHKRQVGTIVFGVFIWKKIQNRVINYFKDEKRGKHNPCLLHLHCQERNWADYSFFYTLQILKRRKQQVVHNDGNFKKKSWIHPKEVST